MADIRSSGQLEQDANVILAIERQRDPNYHTEPAVVRVLKARGGPCGVVDVEFRSGHFFGVAS
jgi:replicative DNA helicase